MRKLGWDALLHQAMRFSGCASFADCDGGLTFQEDGTLSFGRFHGPAMQRYLFLPAGSAATIRFPDGRLFHRIDLAMGHAAASHDCPPDLYHGRYRILGPDLWLMTWRTAGPRKQQVIASRFHRE